MKEFFEKLCEINNITRRDVVEKDYYLHLLLNKIAKNKYLRSSLVFKGGTCLIKGYIGYVRFSEDLDFSWRNQRDWKGLTISKIKNQCSRNIDMILPMFSEISKNLGLIFEGDKKNPEEVHISSGGRMVDLYVHYNSEILGLKSFFKIQLNFLEKYFYDFNTVKLQPYAPYNDEELRFIFKEQIEKYSIPITLNAYNLKEIYIEKCRAILTRKIFKLRDLIDLYFIERQFQYTIDKFEDEILKKTQFALESHDKYRKNIEKLPMPNFSSNDELKLLLIKSPQNFEENLKKIYFSLNELRIKILNEIGESC